ncbi:transposase family protein [Streptomyces prasinus]|uniref:transposase family protein n=1 Tax=Streptomyces prasinus TaxID=67345 RepID=UPI0037CD8AFD
MHYSARDAVVSRATGYRYLHEAIDVLVDQAPDLYNALKGCQTQGMAHVIPDGTLIECDRAAGVRENGNDPWFSQKHEALDGNVQFLSASDGTPLWVSEVEPGSTPDISAARIHALPVLYKAAAQGLPMPADKSCIGAGIRVPARCPEGQSEQVLHVGTRTTNMLIRDLRARGERTAAELKERWRAQARHAQPEPDLRPRRAALVLNDHWK